MEEIDEIKYVLKNNFIKICLFIIIVGVIYYVLFYFNIWNVDTIDEIMCNIKSASDFPGFSISDTLIHDNSKEKNNQVLNYISTHFIIYGATETGKTTFVMKYIESNYQKTNVHIFRVDYGEYDDWTGFPNIYSEAELERLENMDNFKGAPNNKSLIVLDDMGGLIKQKTISEILY